MATGNQKVYLTQEGLEKLQKELKNLVNVRKPQVVERLATTRVPGELVENNDYNQAKQDLAFVEGRISELEEILARAEVIKKNHSGDHRRVGLGCQIEVEVNGRNNVFHLVGEWEADPLNQKISYESPLGKALLGKKVGEKVEVEAPAGKLVYTILAIK